MAIVSGRSGYRTQQHKRPSRSLAVLVATLLIFVGLTTYSYHSLRLIQISQWTAASSIVSKERFMNNSLKKETSLLFSEPSLFDGIHNLSSVDYNACCGLGHRLSKLSDAYYAATKLGFALRSFWGYCDAVEVYHFLFGPQPRSELTHVRHTNHFVRVSNEVDGMIKFYRNSSADQCPCVQDKVDSDVRFYSQHRERFRGRQMVDDYRNENFHSNITTIGIHIRAGNGEAGDFQNRGRTIEDQSSWLRRVVQLILSRSEWKKNKPLQVFVATDTGAIINELESLLEPHGISVLHLQQIRPKEGEGVLFGARGKVLGSGFKCWRSWESTLMDMIFLSYTDVVIAARPSSFTQSMPLSLVMARENHSVSQPFCEMNPEATDMRCYSSYSDWCCHGDTDFALANIHQRYEYLRMPKSGYDARDIYETKIQSRGIEGCIPRPAGWKQPCLPYNFEESLIEMRRTESKSSRQVGKIDIDDMGTIHR